jgi:ABC-type transport system involved in multi-copper enzyme maturation permease subunit
MEAEIMEDIMRSAAHPLLMWLFGASGDALAIIGIVIAIKQTTLGGLSPVVWLLFAIICYIAMIWVVAVRILVTLENQTERHAE